MSDVNIGSVMHNADTCSSLPSTLRGKFDIKLIYKYCNTIGRKILNYNKILRSIGSLSYNEIMELPCNCQDSIFRNDTFGHIITGDLSIIEEPKLRELCSYGTKFREKSLF